MPWDVQYTKKWRYVFVVDVNNSDLCSGSLKIRNIWHHGIISDDVDMIFHERIFEGHFALQYYGWFQVEKITIFSLWQLVALLVYADSGNPVEKPKDDAEAPLLTTFDGVEFPSTERSIKLIHGRASFKLKISQVCREREHSPAGWSFLVSYSSSSSLSQNSLSFV